MKSLSSLNPAARLCQGTCRRLICIPPSLFPGSKDGDIRVRRLGFVKLLVMGFRAYGELRFAVSSGFRTYNCTSREQFVGPLSWVGVFGGIQEDTRFPEPGTRRHHAPL